MRLNHARGIGFNIRLTPPHVYRISAQIEVHNKCHHCEEQGALVLSITLLLFTAEVAIVITT